MQLTKEQTEIIHSNGDIKVNAVAGSGKTTTIIEYAKSRPEASAILYIAFNRSVKLEAIKKFAEHNLDNVQIETTHSLAYKYIVPKYQYKVRRSAYKLYEIVDLLKLKSSDGLSTEYIIANHILKFVVAFCNSTETEIGNFDYQRTIKEPGSKNFVATFFKLILKKAIEFYKMMDNGDAEIIHDFYLKKFQLSKPKLKFDYILFDEGQDASPVMLNVVLSQSSTKVIVGDTHQQIYSWRSAVNSMEKVDFKIYHLSTSFRFKQDIADLAIRILKLKNWVTYQDKVRIFGEGKSSQKKSHAILARTNFGLLLRAIEVTSEQLNIQRIYFEGNINSYIYAEDGTSLYDVLNMYLGKFCLVKDVVLKRMGSFEALESYISKTDDIQLSMMVDIVKRFRDNIPSILARLKYMHVANEERDSAQIIFSTVHRAKGMEYDVVELVNDFITEQKITALCVDKTSSAFDENKLIEEINLLYVAITRVKNKLIIPDKLLPIGFVVKESIVVETVFPNSNQNLPELEFPNCNKVPIVRSKVKPVFKPWNVELDRKLTDLYCKGERIEMIAIKMGKSMDAIHTRIKKLHLDEIFRD